MPENNKLKISVRGGIVRGEFQIADSLGEARYVGNDPEAIMLELREYKAEYPDKSFEVEFSGINGKYADRIRQEFKKDSAFSFYKK